MDFIPYYSEQPLHSHNHSSTQLKLGNNEDGYGSVKLRFVKMESLICTTARSHMQSTMERKLDKKSVELD